MTQEEFWKMELRFWLDGPGFYETSLAPAVHMIFPAPVGILAGGEILESLRQGPRWKSVSFDNKAATQLAETAVLTYEATGERDGEKPYTTLCGSIYVHHNGKWLLLFHQQTPVK